MNARHAAVLAGGRSSRMGRPKAGIPLAGEPLISYPLAAATAAGLEPVVIAKATSDLPDLSCRVIDEPDDPVHPLTGIIAALELIDRPLVVVACDVPLIPAALLAELACRSGPFAIPANPRPQPLVARYDPELLPRLRAALITGEPMVKLAAELGGEVIATDRLRAFGDPEEMFSNVNDPDELTRIESLL